jgi:hypothetical protein
MNNERCAICDTEVDKECWCFGCKSFVCGEHATLFGWHELVDHEVADWDSGEGND